MKKFNKKQIIILIIIILISAIIYYHFINEKNFLEENSEINNLISGSHEGNISGNNGDNAEENNQKTKIKVYIAGEVVNRGVYELEENSRIADVIEQAGGLTEQAYIDKINLAYILEDGMKVYIPNINEDIDFTSEDSSSYISTGSEGIETGGNGDLGTSRRHKWNYEQWI